MINSRRNSEAQEQGRKSRNNRKQTGKIGIRGMFSHTVAHSVIPRKASDEQAVRVRHLPQSAWKSQLVRVPSGERQGQPQVKRRQQSGTEGK